MWRLWIVALVEGRVQCFPLVGGAGLVETSVFSAAILSLRKSLKLPFLLLLLVREWPPFLPNRVSIHAKIHQQRIEMLGTRTYSWRPPLRCLFL